MTDAGVAFTWDVPSISTSGVNLSRVKAERALAETLSGCEPGASGELWASRCTGEEYVPEELLGRAERTADGVAWLTPDVPGGPPSPGASGQAGA